MPSYISPGEGVAKEANQEEDNLEVAAPLGPEIPDALPIEPYKSYLPKDYGDVPSLQGQLLTHPDSVKSSQRLVKVFDLSIAEDAQAYADIKAKTLPDDSPIYVIETEVREFHNGVFYVFLQYVQLKYKNLAPRQKS